MEVEEASCLRHEADIVLCSSGKKKNMCAFGILKTRTHTLETHTATHFILETQGHPFYPNSGSLPSLLLV